MLNMTYYGSRQSFRTSLVTYLQVNVFSNAQICNLLLTRTSAFLPLAMLIRMKDEGQLKFKAAARHRFAHLLECLKKKSLLSFHLSHNSDSSLTRRKKVFRLDKRIRANTKWGLPLKNTNYEETVNFEPWVDNHA